MDRGLMAMNGDRPRIVVVSHVVPVAVRAGQQQRVRNVNRALRSRFDLTFVTPALTGDLARHRDELAADVDQLVEVPRVRSAAAAARGAWHMLRWAGRRSNATIGDVLLSPERIRSVLPEILRRGPITTAFFHYPHAAEATSVFHELGVPCALDMHDVLWRSRDEQLARRRWLPAMARRALVARYRRWEQRSWARFDTVVAISEGEYEYARAVLGPRADVVCIPMGVDMDDFPYSWAPLTPPRIGYYGNLGSTRAVTEVETCYRDVMPMVWDHHPEATLWVVGSNAPAAVHALADADPRVRVTGYVDDVVGLLSTFSVVLCPFTGTYGFRSRIIELLAVGVPVVATEDAVHGMNLAHGAVTLSAPDTQMSAAVLRFLADPELADVTSRQARRHVEETFSYDATYGRLADLLLQQAAVDRA